MKSSNAFPGKIDEISSRIACLRKALGLRQNTFGARLGMGRSTLSMIESGKNAVTEQNIRLISLTFNVNEDWLRSGKGPMFTTAPHATEFFTIFGELLPETQGALLRLAKELLAIQGLSKNSNDP